MCFEKKKNGEDWVECNAEPINQTTDFTDEPPSDPNEYSWFVQPVLGQQEGPPTQVVQLAPGQSNPPYFVMPFIGDNRFYKTAIADLDGDGTLDWVVKQPIESIDPYVDFWVPSGDTYKIEAYANDGTPLWQHDLGWSIEMGIWYSPYIAKDLDGDQQAEVILKTGEGDPRDADGKVTSGPEYLTVLNGKTGALIAQTNWPSRDGLGGYNFASRNQIGVAYLDGVIPHIIVERGTYWYMKVLAYRLDGNTLTEVWHWDNLVGAPEDLKGQGAHWMLAADLDADGFDEVILGSLVLDHDGTPLWTTGLRHPDYVYLSDLDPNRPGWEIYYAVETPQAANGMCMVDAATGEILWGFTEATTHIHFGFCGDITANHDGSECYGGERDDVAKRWLWSADGEILSNETFGATATSIGYWDADRQKELLGDHKITKYQGDILATALYGNINQVADIVGDWREEIIVFTNAALG